MLRVDRVTAGYNEVDIIHDVSVKVGPGEIVTIIGPNGSGKSTMMKSIFGLTHLRSGTISFGRREISGMRPDHVVRLGISYVPQERNIFPSLTVRENLEMGAYIKGCRIGDRLNEIVQLFPELKDRMGQRAGTMSGGEQKMLAICRALVIQPSLLLLDEPSAALSPRLVDQVFSKIKSINEGGVAIMMIEQNTRKALAISDRGYIFDMGRNKLEGPGCTLLDDPNVRRLYLGR
jgi:ABC-type branched-subunit amino acid transport system ATPase component